jgi:hypothetical protein
MSAGSPLVVSQAVERQVQHVDIVRDLPVSHGAAALAPRGGDQRVGVLAVALLDEL